MNAHALPISDIVEASAGPVALPEIVPARRASDWNPQDFAREQIRGLVRLVFFTGGARPVKHVILSGAEPNLDVGTICDMVARVLARETRSDVAVLECERTLAEVPQVRLTSPRNSTTKLRSTHLGTNLWRVPAAALGDGRDEVITGTEWVAHLADLSREFQHVLIHGPTAGTSSEVALLGRLTDGVILVLGAHSTRKATALKIKEGLEAGQARILGTVLSERTFPIPERIYRRL